MTPQLETALGSIFSIGLTFIVLTRFVLILRLYALKDGKIFSSTIEGEIISFLASQTLPFPLSVTDADSKTSRIVRFLNILMTAYWIFLLSIIAFVVILNILS
jgi:hypothetical protein